MLGNDQRTVKQTHLFYSIFPILLPIYSSVDNPFAVAFLPQYLRFRGCLLFLPGCEFLRISETRIKVIQQSCSVRGEGVREMHPRMHRAERGSLRAAEFARAPSRHHVRLLFFPLRAIGGSSIGVQRQSYLFSFFFVSL